MVLAELYLKRRPPDFERQIAFGARPSEDTLQAEKVPKKGKKNPAE
jgi:hypothetical protein